MLRLNRFDYIAPDSLSEALDLLTEPDSTVMAGGTDVLVNIKHRVATPRRLISIRRLPELIGMEDGAEGVTILAGTTLADVATDARIRSRYPALGTAAELISTPQVREVGTLGGNVCLDVRCNYYNQSYEWRKGIGFCMKRDSEICRVAPGGDRCWAVASADTVPVLIALGAEITIASKSGTRRQQLETLYQDDGLTPLRLQPGEIVTAIHLPADPPACAYQKFRLRHSFDFPLVAVAVSILMDGSIVRQARIVLTAVASYPERAERAEAILTGNALSPEIIAAAGETVFRQAKPMDNTAGSIFHRKRMARVLFERAARRLAGIEEPLTRTA